MLRCGILRATIARYVVRMFGNEGVSVVLRVTHAHTHSRVFQQIEAHCGILAMSGSASPRTRARLMSTVSVFLVETARPPLVVVKCRTTGTPRPDTRRGATSDRSEEFVALSTKGWRARLRVPFLSVNLRAGIPSLLEINVAVCILVYRMERGRVQ